MYIKIHIMHVSPEQLGRLEIVKFLYEHGAAADVAQEIMGRTAISFTKDVVAEARRTDKQFIPRTLTTVSRT